MNRSLVSVLAALTLTACCSADERTFAPAESAMTKVEGGQKAPALDLSIVPSTVEEAQRLCASPPSDWETTSAPARADYYGETWVLCHPYAPVIHTPPTDQCEMNAIMEGCGMCQVEGRPHESWSFGFTDEKELGIWFPIDADVGHAHGFGAPENARGGHRQWLRLPVKPEDSGALAPRLSGMREAIFVRLKRELPANGLD